MTDLHFWKCDVCGKVVQYQNNMHKFSYEIKINISSNYARPDDNKEYKDVCDKCHEKFINLIYKFQENDNDTAS